MGVWRRTHEFPRSPLHLRAARAPVNHLTLRRVYLGAEPTGTPDAAGTSAPSPRSSSAACAPRRTSCPRTSSRRPPWAAAGTGRSCAAAGSTPRSPCWTRGAPRCLREKAPSLLLETSRLNFSLFFSSSLPPGEDWSEPTHPSPHFPSIPGQEQHGLHGGIPPGGHTFLRLSTLSWNFKVAAQIFSRLHVKLRRL